MSLNVLISLSSVGHANLNESIFLQLFGGDYTVHNLCYIFI